MGKRFTSFSKIDEMGMGVLLHCDLGSAPGALYRGELISACVEVVQHPGIVSDGPLSMAPLILAGGHHLWLRI
jgi:hypothetical protein